MKPISNFLNKAYLIRSSLQKKSNLYEYLLAGILVTIPLDFAFGSISCMLFFLLCIFDFKNLKVNFNIAFIFPVLFFILMVFSLLWTHDLQLTIAGLQKEILFLLMPTAFLFIPKLSKEIVIGILKIYSYVVVLYAAFFISKAIIKFIQTKNNIVFFYHELVSLELNAIYISAFASLGLFYFIQLAIKNDFEKFAIFLLTLFIFLLSSKSIIFIDFILIICFYMFFSKTPKSVKIVTITTMACFLVFSVVFVQQIRDRFLVEYETAFIDNTENSNNKSVINVSVRQAWNDKKFTPNNFFSGTALRVYQFRVFKEIILEKNKVLTGFGLSAAQHKIKEKELEYNLYQGYGDYNFHNQYTQSFAEIGLFGFLLLLAMIFINLKNAIQNKDFLHIVFAVTIIMLFLTESFFCRQRGIVFFITLYCIFNSIDYNQDSKKEIQS